MDEVGKSVSIRDNSKIRKALGSDDSAIRFQRMQEISAMLWLPDGLDNERRLAKVQAALDDLAAIEPRDPFERMLSLQMIGCDEAIKECFRRAMIEGQTLAGRNASLSHAQKLMTTYAKLLETLNKHRGKGQQKITIEHVNVHAGGQAVVGSVTTGEPRQENPEHVPDLKTIPNEPDIPMDTPKSNKSKPDAATRKKIGGS